MVQRLQPVDYILVLPFDVWITEGDQIAARYTDEGKGKGTWRVLQGAALQKAREMIDTAHIDSDTPMKERGHIETSEDDWVPIP
jgi:hypothetical protein